MEPAGPPLDLSEVTRLVTAFDDDSVSLEGFHHRQHLIVAASLLDASPYDVALARMRKGLFGLLAKAGKDAYHETVTVFWMRALRHRLSACDASLSARDRIREAVTWAEGGQPLRAHYSAELIASDAAKKTFVEPDLRPLPQ